jgi:hypothetical protein
MDLVDRTQSTFTKQELARLTAYRAAVAAGFYTDWDGSAETADTNVLAWLGNVPGDTAGEAYPFTAAERQQLERCRAAVAGGYYSDDLPPAEAGATPEQPAR